MKKLIIAVIMVFGTTCAFAAPKTSLGFKDVPSKGVLTCTDGDAEQGTTVIVDYARQQMQISGKKTGTMIYEIKISDALKQKNGYIAGLNILGSVVSESTIGHLQFVAVSDDAKFNASIAYDFISGMAVLTYVNNLSCAVTEPIDASVKSGK